MPEDDQTTLGYNNDEANQVFRICVEEGVEAETAKRIAVKISEAYARSWKGKTEKKVGPLLIAGICVGLTSLGGGVLSWIMGVFDK